jgi:hypothetical protein
VDLYKLIETITGVAGYSSRDTVRFEFGRAYIVLPRKWPAPNPNDDFYMNVFYRKEGVGDFTDQQQIQLPYKEIGNFARIVLSTGRTVEVGQGVGLRYIGFDIPTSGGVNVPWTSLVKSVLKEHSQAGDDVLDLSPDYQRGVVWDAQRQSAFIGHALSGGMVSPMYFARDPSYKTLRVEVVDGQQRLTAITKFITGEIPGRLLNGRELWYRDFNEVDRRDRRLDAIVIYGAWSRRQRLEFYLGLNSGGVAHTQEELCRVMDLLKEEKHNE